MSRRIRALVAGAAVLATVVTVAVSAGVGGAASGGRAAHGVAYVAVTHKVGNTYYAAGNTSTNVLGSGAVAYKINVGTGATTGTIKITANLTLFTKTGALSGSSSGTETVGASGSSTQKGTLHLTHGSGGQRGHSLIGTFTGTGASATGPFVYHVKGTYK